VGGQTDGVREHRSPGRTGCRSLGGRRHRPPMKELQRASVAGWKRSPGAKDDNGRWGLASFGSGDWRTAMADG
jgi:hypothetical protein